MSFILFLAVAAALGLILLPFFDDKKWGWVAFFAFVGSMIITGTGTYQLCADGWNSPSIGKQGACSHHGGVVTNLNEVGWIALVLSGAFIVYVFFFSSKQKEKDE